MPSHNLHNPFRQSTMANGPPPREAMAMADKRQWKPRIAIRTTVTAVETLPTATRNQLHRMKVEITTKAFSFALRSPVVHPWRRRTFLIRRRRSTTAHEKITRLAARRTATLNGKPKDDTFVRQSPLSRKACSGEAPTLVAEEESKSRPADSAASLGSIGEHAAMYHQKRQLRRQQRVLNSKQSEKKRAGEYYKKRSFPVVTTEGSSTQRTPSKDKVMQLTGLSSISPVARPPKKQRFS